MGPAVEDNKLPPTGDDNENSHHYFLGNPEIGFLGAAGEGNCFYLGIRCGYEMVPNRNGYTFEHCGDSLARFTRGVVVEVDRPHVLEDRIVSETFGVTIEIPLTLIKETRPLK